MKAAELCIHTAVFACIFFSSNVWARSAPGRIKKMEKSPFSIELRISHAAPATGGAVTISARLRNISSMDQKFLLDFAVQPCELQIWNLKGEKVVATTQPEQAAAKPELFADLMPKESTPAGEGVATLQGESYQITWSNLSVPKVRPGQYKIKCVWNSQRAAQGKTNWLGQVESNSIEIMLPAKGEVIGLEEAKGYKVLGTPPAEAMPSSSELRITSESLENLMNGHAFQCAFRVTNYGSKTAHVFLQGRKIKGPAQSTQYLFADLQGDGPGTVSAGSDSVWATFEIPSHHAVRIPYGFRYSTIAVKEKKARVWKLIVNGTQVLRKETDTF